MSSVLSSFVLSSSCSDISANLLLLNQLETHGMKQLEWLANRGDIVDGSFVDPALLQVWLDKILPDLVELTEAMRFQADNISVYRLAEMQIDIARAQTNEHFMQALLLELTNDLDHEDSYSDPDLFALERLRDTAEEIKKEAAFLQEFCWWLHQQLARKAQFYWVEFDFTGPYRGQPWLSEADLVWQLPVPRWYKRGQFKSYLTWRKYQKWMRSQESED